MNPKEANFYTFIELWRGRYGYPESLQTWIDKLELKELISLIETVSSTHQTIHQFPREDRYSSLAWLNAQLLIRQYQAKTLRGKSRNFLKRIFRAG